MAGPHADAPGTLDATSWGIVEQLRQDGRRPYAAIGQAVGLSEAAVRQRVQRLLTTGVLRIAAVTDPARMGLHRQATVGVRAEGDLEELADSVAAVPEVDSVVVTAGSIDVLADVVCRDDEHLLAVVRRIRRLPGVRTTETFVHLRRRDRLRDATAPGAGTGVAPVRPAG